VHRVDGVEPDARSVGWISVPLVPGGSVAFPAIGVSFLTHFRPVSPALRPRHLNLAIPRSVVHDGLPSPRSSRESMFLVIPALSQRLLAAFLPTSQLAERLSEGGLRSGTLRSSRGIT
jgi:hypothetical protein